MVQIFYYLNDECDDDHTSTCTKMYHKINRTLLVLCIPNTGVLSLSHSPSFSPSFSHPSRSKVTPVTRTISIPSTLLIPSSTGAGTASCVPSPRRDPKSTPACGCASAQQSQQRLVQSSAGARTTTRSREPVSSSGGTELLRVCCRQSAMRNTCWLLRMVYQARGTVRCVCRNTG